MNSKRGPARLAVLMLDIGSNTQAFLHVCAGPSYGARVVAMGADRRGTPAIRTAEEAGVLTFVHVLSEHPSQEKWDEFLRDAVAAYKPDIVVPVDFPKFVDPEPLAAFPQRVVNTHNALLSPFPGIYSPTDALAYGVKVTDATLFVVSPGTDTGPILGQTTCPVLEGDSEEVPVKRIKEVGRVQPVELIGRMAREGW